MTNHPRIRIRTRPVAAALGAGLLLATAGLTSVAGAAPNPAAPIDVNDRIVVTTSRPTTTRPTTTTTRRLTVPTRDLCRLVPDRCRPVPCIVTPPPEPELDLRRQATGADELTVRTLTTRTLTTQPPTTHCPPPTTRPEPKRPTVEPPVRVRPSFTG